MNGKANKRKRTAAKPVLLGGLKQALSMLHNRALPVLLCSEVYPVYLASAL